MDTLLLELDITATGVIKDRVVIIEFSVFLDSSLQMLAQARWIELSVALLKSFTWWLNSTSWSILVSSNFSYLLMLATISPTSTLFWTVLSDPQEFASLQRWLNPVICKPFHLQTNEIYRNNGHAPEQYQNIDY